MIEAIKHWIFPWLKIEDVQPVVPAGHENDRHVQIMRAAPSYLRFNLFLWGLKAVTMTGTILIISIALLSINSLFLWLLFPLWVGSLAHILILCVIAYLDYEMRWYIITDRSVFIREGIWIIREITLTFANAQNVHIRQGPVERLLGFANVEVDTAGGGSRKKEEGTINPHRAVIRGIENAPETRDRILELLRHHRTVGLGDPDDMLHSSSSSAFDSAILQEILSEAQQLRQSLTVALMDKNKI